MFFNPFTKKRLGRKRPIDLVDELPIDDNIKNLYYRYQELCNQYLSSLPQYDPDRSGYYVYAWCTNTDPKRYFYVGKGTGNRWRHVLSDIENARTGKHNKRFERYALLQDKFGISCDLMLKDLTEYEALIAEECLKLRFCEQGEVLLNVEGIPDQYLPIEWSDPTERQTNTPTLDVDAFRVRYLDDMEVPHFDEVDLNCLMRAWFYPFGIKDTTVFEENRRYIANYIIRNGGKVYEARHVSPKVQCVIVQGRMDQDCYSRLREQNKKIYSIDDILVTIPDQEVSEEDLMMSDAKVALVERENQIIGYIMKLLVEDIGVPKSKFSIDKYQDEKRVCVGDASISIKVYKKSNKAYVTIPLDLAGELRPRLTHVTSWKGNFEFSSLNELDDLKPFLGRFIINAKRRMVY